MKTHIYTHIPEANFLPLPVWFTSASSRHRQENVSRPSGLWKGAQILLVLEGTGVLYCDGKRFPLQKGCAFYVEQAIPHSYENTGDLVTAWITWVGSGQEELSRYIGKKSYLYCEQTDVKQYAAEIERIEKEYFSHKREGVLSAITYTLVLRFFDEQKEPCLSGLDRVLRYMEAHFSERVRLSELVALSHSSRSVFCKAFKERYGCSAFEKLMEIRLLNARTMLQSNPDKAVSEIARSCGFEDMSYFGKAYKKRFAVTPTADRERS